MKFSLFIVASFLGVAQAFLIPRGLPDGSYTAIEDPNNATNTIIARDLEDGTFVTLDDTFNATKGVVVRNENGASRSTYLNRGKSFSSRRRATSQEDEDVDSDVARRDLKEVVTLANNYETCYTGDKFERKDLLPAISDMFLEPLYFVERRTVKFVIRDSVVVYMCNHSTHNRENSCSLIEFMVAMEKLDTLCGTETSGRLRITPWGKTYGRARTGQEICERRSFVEYFLKHTRTNYLSKVEKGCSRYISAYDRILGQEHNGDCNENAGYSIWWRTKQMFPWWHEDNQRELAAKKEQYDAIATLDTELANAHDRAKSQTFQKELEMNLQVEEARKQIADMRGGMASVDGRGKLKEGGLGYEFDKSGEKADDKESKYKDEEDR